MDTLAVADDPLSALLTVILTKFMAHLHCVCFVARTRRSLAHSIDTHGGDKDRVYPPILTVIWDDDTADDLDAVVLNLVNASCQGLIVAHDLSVQFLDSFNRTFDRSDQRFSAVHFVVLPGPSAPSPHATMTRIFNHFVLRNLYNVLVINPVANDGGTFALHTHRFVTETLSATPFLVDFYNGTSGTFAFGSPLFPDKLTNLEQKSVTIALINYSPFCAWQLTAPGHGNAKDSITGDEYFIDGTEIELILVFCQVYNCSVKSHLEDEHLWGTIYANRTGDGILGALAERRADVGVGALYMWQEPYPYLSVSVIISRSGITLLVPKPSLLPGYLIPLRPFTIVLWLAVLISFCMAIISFRLADIYRIRTDENISPNDRQLSKSVMNVVGIYLMNTVQFNVEKLPEKILFASFVFGGLMIGNAYSGGLSAVMTIPRYQNPIDTIQDVVENRLIWLGNHISWLLAIWNDHNPLIVKLIKQYRIYSEEELHGISARHERYGYCLERLVYGNYAVPSFLVSDELKAMADDLYWQYTVLFFSKLWALEQPMNMHVLHVFESGMQKYWENSAISKYSTNNLQNRIIHSRGKEQNSEPITLQLTHVMGIYIIWTLGLGLSCLVFIGEILMHRRDMRKSQRVQAL